MRLLVTGFEAFPGVPTNPTVRILEGLGGSPLGVELDTAVLPVDSERVREVLEPHWARRPDAAIHFGVAHDSRVIRLELRAENRLAFRVPDNAGLCIDDAAIENGGPTFVATRLPVELCARRFARRGIPYEMSDSAGQYLCNQVMYSSLRQMPDDVSTGFVHVPPDEELSAALGGASYLPIAVQVAAARIVVAATVEALIARRSS